MLLAELLVRHTRRHMPTRRVAIGEAYLPTSGPRTARSCSAPWWRSICPSSTPSRRSCCPGSSRNARDGLSVPRLALRFRLQTDTHGLDRSRHRIVSEHGRLVLELDRHGRPDPQILGAVMAAAVVAAVGAVDLVPGHRRRAPHARASCPRGSMCGDSCSASRARRRRLPGEKGTRELGRVQRLGRCGRRPPVGDGGPRRACGDGPRSGRRASPVPQVGAPGPPRPRRGRQGCGRAVGRARRGPHGAARVSSTSTASASEETAG